MKQTLFAVAAILVAANAAAEKTAKVLSVTAVSMDVAFGSVVPQGMQPPLPAAVLVRSNTPWTLLTTFEPQAGSLDTRRDEIEMRTAGTAWTRLVEGIPVRIAAGDATPDAGVATHAEIRVKPSVESAPGRRLGTLAFSTAGPQATTTIPLSYEIGVWSTLDADPRPFESPAINPARPGLYPYDRRQYLARSNMPWIVELIVSELKGRSAAMQLPPNTLVVLREGQDPLPVVAGQPLMVARGLPTGREGVVVDLQLAVRVDEAAMTGGEYAADMKVVIRPDGANTASTAQSR